MLDIAEGRHEERLSLIGPQGLRSRQTIDLTTLGLSEQAWTEALQQQATAQATGDSQSASPMDASQNPDTATSDANVEPTHQAPLTGGTPTDDLSATPGTAHSDSMQSTSTHSGAASPDGQGLGGGEGAAIGQADRLAGGVSTETLLTEKMTIQARNMAQTAPPAYRHLVAAYFMRLSHPGEQEKQP
jgi:hypothetical protein